ncbi:MAG: hypothetical protein V9G21_12935 [Methylotenera sp.]|nr:hypothetical protein [Methylotenera sp.]HPM50495.1 hypothetical protein [Methylotenera sp.]
MRQLDLFSQNQLAATCEHSSEQVTKASSSNVRNMCMKQQDNNFRASVFGVMRMRAVVIAITSVLTANVAYADDEVRFDGLAGSSATSEVSHLVNPQTPETDPDVKQPLSHFAGTSQNGTVDYKANEAVGKIAVEIDKDGLPADGQSAVEVTVKLSDLNAQNLEGVAYITVETSGGRVLLPGQSTDELGPEGGDLDKVTPGTQVKVENGLATFKLLAPAEPQDVNVRITAGNVSAAGTVSFVPELREMVAAGLIEGIISKRNISAGSLSPNRREDGFEQQIRRWSNQFQNGKANAAMRTAFFIKGKIKGDALLTAAFDSDKETRARLLRDIRPDEFYPVYGDSSIHGFDARSSDRLYVRIDKNKHYALYGDFSTGSGFSQQTAGGNVASLQLRNLGQYNRTATGFRGHFEQGNVLGNAFLVRDNLKQAIEEYPGNGTSGPFAVKNNSALENSEKVEIVIRDKDQLNVVKEVIALSRFEDYVFEPFSGRILLKTPLMALTPNGDRQSLRITYEVEQEDGEQFWVGGIDGQIKITNNIEVGGAWVEDRNPLSPYRLQSVNTGIKLGENTMLVGEIARSDSTQYQNGTNLFSTPTGQAGEIEQSNSGNAYRVEIVSKSAQDALKPWNAKAWWARSDADFDNSATGYTQGKGEAGARAKIQLSEFIGVYGEAIRSEDRALAGEAVRTGEKLGLTAKVTDKLTLDGFVRHISEDGNFAPQALIGSNNAPLGGTLNQTGGFYGLGQDQNGFASTGIASRGPGLSDSLDATTVGLGAHYQATEKLNLDALFERGGENQKRIVLGSQYQIAERTKLYARAETQTGLASSYSLDAADRSTSFSAGVDTSYMKGGNLFSEYRLRDALSGQQADIRDMQLANGARNVWDISEGVTVNTGIEYLKIFKGGQQNAMALTGGMDYNKNPLWKASGRIEFRRLFDNNAVSGNQSSNQWLNTLSFARKLDRDWTLLTRNYLLYTRNNEDASGLAKGNTFQDRFQIGAAWRPVDHNQWNGLARYEYKKVRDDSLAKDATGVSTGEDYRTHIASAHMDYHPSRPWWMTGRVAAKRTTDDTLPSDKTYTAYLVSGRTVYDITEKWDLGVMGSVLYSPQGSATQWAAGLEAGYQLQTNLWASAGFNWSGFHDRDLSGSDYTAQGFYVRLRFKFDENLFSGKSEEVNRTLERTDSAPEIN